MKICICNPQRRIKSHFFLSIEIARDQKIESDRCVRVQPWLGIQRFRVGDHDAHGDTKRRAKHEVASCDHFRLSAENTIRAVLRLPGHRSETDRSVSATSLGDISTAPNCLRIDLDQGRTEMEGILDLHQRRLSQGAHVLISRLQCKRHRGYKRVDQRRLPYVSS